MLYQFLSCPTTKRIADPCQIAGESYHTRRFHTAWTRSSQCGRQFHSTGSAKGVSGLLTSNITILVASCTLRIRPVILT